MEYRICYRCMKKISQAVCRYCMDDSRIPNEPHQLSAGTVLNGQYFIGRPLGQGGFGITYTGMDLYADRQVAVKEYFPSGIVMRDTALSSDVRSLSGESSFYFEKHKERFLREYQTLSELCGIPQIVKVSDFFSANNTAYIVMEYIEGITLKQYVAVCGGRLSGARTFQILKPVMDSLIKIHQAGLVHRDVSPDNLMLLPDGSVKLLDFGAVRDIGTNAEADMPLTRSTAAVYKNGYAPLEQYQSRGSLGPWTDVYAVCATVCYCLTGQVPPEALERLLQDTPVRIREMGADVSEYEEKVLRQGMELRVGDRIAGIQQLYEALAGQPESSLNRHGKTAELSLNRYEKTAGSVRNRHGKTAEFSQNIHENMGKSAGGRKHGKKRRFIMFFGMILCCAVSAMIFYSVKPAANKAIAAPIYFRNVSEDMEGWGDTGTSILVECADVDAFSEEYTYSCSLYIPKASCKEDMSQIIVHWWLDMNGEDEHIGTTDSRYVWNMINSQNEVFSVIEDSLGNVLEKSESIGIFRVEETGYYYKLEVKDLPFEMKMHSEDGENRNIEIDTERAGKIVVGVSITGLNQSLSSVVYLDDIVIKDHGTVIKSLDCSAESLYNHFYYYDYDNEHGERMKVDQPDTSEIRVWRY